MAGTREIPLTHGAVALVDEGDYERLVAMGKWHLSDTGYAVRRNNGATIRMHRVVNNTPDGLVTDHINHNPLDNRRSNLRSCDQLANARNRANQGRGYWFQKQNSNWVVEVHGKHRGVFDSESEAASFAQSVYAGLVDKKPRIPRTHCVYGHSLDDAYWYNDAQHCKPCQQFRSKKYYRRKYARD